jgi:hypothetical protein
MEHNHLSAAEIAGFLDRTLESEMRSHAVAHLAECERCRDELAACARLASTAPPARRTSVLWQAVAGVAAVLLIAVVLRSGRHPDSSVGSERILSAERSAPMTSRITTLFPADTVAIARSKLRFMWKRDAGASAYSVTITDANGKLVYGIDEISDTVFTLPDTVRFTSSTVYFWNVDAPHADGSSAKSGSVPFRVAP